MTELSIIRKTYMNINNKSNIAKLISFTHLCRFPLYKPKHELLLYPFSNIWCLSPDLKHKIKIKVVPKKKKKKNCTKHKSSSVFFFLPAKAYKTLRNFGDESETKITKKRNGEFVQSTNVLPISVKSEKKNLFFFLLLLQVCS